MNVANILPKDHIEVELRYTELLVPTDGVYELVYPTVVGPRYASARVDAADSHNKFVATPYQHAGQAPTYTFGMAVTIAGGMPIQSLDSPTHAINTAWGANHSGATIALDPSEKSGGDRDFILHYRLAGTDIASGLLLYQGKDENFFLMMVQPPHRPAIELIPPREYVFILDVSGSMIGQPLDVEEPHARPARPPAPDGPLQRPLVFRRLRAVLAAIRRSQPESDRDGDPVHRQPERRRWDRVATRDGDRDEAAPRCRGRVA